MTPGIVLYADDDENDRLLMRHAFRKADAGGTLRVVSDGQQAVDYLSGAGAFASREKNPLPHLLLLDVKMPGLSGFEVLRWVRGHARFRKLPVVMLTSSNQDADFRLADALGATAYLIKPSRLSDLVDLIAQVRAAGARGIAEIDWARSPLAPRGR